MPLWASYLVKAYAWRAMVQPGGRARLGARVRLTPGFGLTAVVITLAYLWLPYMVLPVYAGLDRLPALAARGVGRPGAGAWRPSAASCCPLVKPSIVAGSIFTFSLSLGDYIAVTIVGGKTQMLGNVVYTDSAPSTSRSRPPLATVSVLIMVVYLLAVRRTGALENL